jgi:uncharacterized protein (TIGR02271 family)
MNASMERNTIVGVFEDRAHAQQAINELKRLGFREDQIGVTSRHGQDGDADGDADSFAAEGGMAGLATGAGIGALWGLGIVSGVLPAIGPAIAGGTLAAILSSAAAGAAAAGLAGTLIGLGIPKDEAEFYESEFQAGRTIVTVKADGRGAEARSVLTRFGGYDLSSRPQVSAQASHLTSKQPAAAHSSTSALKGSEGRTLQAKEEQLHVQKHKEQAGEVTIRKEVHTEHKTIEVPVEREEVVIERRPVSGNQPAAGTIAAEGQTIRVPVSEEHVEVTKTPVVKEEVTVGKRKVKETQRVGATVRKEEIKVEKQGDANVRDQR